MLSTRVISFFISVLFLQLHLQFLVYDRNIFVSSLEFFGHPHSSSENVQKCAEIFGNGSEIFGKSPEKLLYIILLHGSLEIRNFSSHGKKYFNTRI